MATEIVYVGAGASSATDGATAPTPTLPTGATGDFQLCFFYSNEAVDGTVSISAGWTQIANERSAGGLFGLWYRFREGGDVAPTFTLSDHASGDTAIAQIAAWTGVSTTDPINNTGVLTDNLAALNIGPISGISIGRKNLIVCLGSKLDDWTSVATLSGDSLTWQEIGEPDSTLGNDAGLVWDYAISTQFEIIVANKTFTVTGGAAVAGKGIMVAFNLDAVAFSAATHLLAYCAQSHPQTDNGIVGGAINPLIRAVFTDLAADDDIEVLSSNVADNDQSITVRGRDALNVLVTESVVLNGTTAVILSTLGVIDRIESILKSGETAGIVTVRRSVAGPTITTIPADELGVRRIFAYAYSHPITAKNYYEKLFIKNTHPLTDLQNAEVSETSDPVGDLTFLLAAGVDDIATSTNRLTTPAIANTLNPDIFDSTDKLVPGLDLISGSAIGVWIKMPIAAAEAVYKNTYQLTVKGDI